MVELPWALMFDQTETDGCANMMKRPEFLSKSTVFYMVPYWLSTFKMSVSYPSNNYIS